MNNTMDHIWSYAVAAAALLSSYTANEWLVIGSLVAVAIRIIVDTPKAWTVIKKAFTKAVDKK